MKRFCFDFPYRNDHAMILSHSSAAPEEGDYEYDDSHNDKDERGRDIARIDEFRIVVVQSLNDCPHS